MSRAVERGSQIDTPTQGTIKVEVTRRADELLLRNRRVIGHDDIDSGVPAQPSTLQEGLLGAGNRIGVLARKLGERRGESLGHENFVHPVSVQGPDVQLWNGAAVFDAAAVVGMNQQGKYSKIYLSAGVRFPQKHFLLAQEAGLATTTVGNILKQQSPGSDFDHRDPHKYFTAGAYRREDLLLVPTYLALMTEGDRNQGKRLETFVRERISNTRMRLPDDIRRVIGASTQRLKTAAIGNVVDMLGGEHLEIQHYDGNSIHTPAQIMDLTSCFKECYDRIETIHSNGGIKRLPGDLSIAIQSCICPVPFAPVTLREPELRFIDLAVVLIEKIDEKGIPHYYTSTSVGTEFPVEKVLLAAREGFEKVTVGKVLAGSGGDPADPQKQLYGVSRQLLLEEAIFATFAQMNSGLEVK